VEQAIALWSAQGRAHSTVVGAMFTLAAGCALNLGRYDQVLELEAQVPRSSMSADVIYSSGIACWLLGRTNEAIERLQRAHDDPSVRQALDNDPARCTWQPLVALSKIYAQLGQDEKSSEYARRALAYKPGDREMEDMLSALTAKMAKREEPVRISACMIVKNEEQGLERCLQSLQGAIDEIVLVDTGSTDKTVAIAEKHGAKVFHFTWCDDFAAARNEAIKQATGNWIIIVDGDDELIESSPGALRRLCASHVGFGYLLNCHSEVEGRQVIGQQWRIAPKLPGLGYKGRIHEQLQPPPGVPCELVLQNDVAIRHWGYTTDRANLEEKHRRNVKLLELTLAEEPNEPFHHYNLAREYGWEQDYGKGLRYAEQALRLWHEQGQPQSLYVGPMFTVAVTMAFNNGQYQRALELDAMTPSGNVSADLLFCAGMACWQLGRHADAVARLERARRDRSLVVSSDADPSLATWQPALALSKIYAELNQADKAYEWASDAAALMPERPDIVLGWAQTAASCGHPDEAISAARSLIGGDADAAYQAQARRLLLDIGDQTNNVALILEALSGEAAGVSEPDAALIRAVAYERLGDLQAQRETLDTASQRFPDDARILLAFARLAASPSVGAGS
jgi:tetratricopeptide (TPR) repeat protein